MCVYVLCVSLVYLIAYEFGFRVYVSVYCGVLVMFMCEYIFVYIITFGIC